MAQSTNLIFLVGNVGQDPEIRETSSGVKTCRLGVATSRRWKDKNGQTQEKTEWHRVVLWNGGKGPQFVDIAEQMIQKGTLVSVQGRVEYRNYQNRDDQTVWVTEIVASELGILTRGKPRPDGTEWPAVHDVDLETAFAAASPAFKRDMEGAYRDE